MYRIHLRNAARPGDKWPILYEISEWNETDWKFMAISIPPGRFSIIFEFQMGFPSQCAAAIDEVDITECTRDMDVKHGFLRDGKSPCQYHTESELARDVVCQVIKFRISTSCPYVGGFKKALTNYLVYVLLNVHL